MTSPSNSFENANPEIQGFLLLRPCLAAFILLVAGLATPQHAEAQYSQTLPWNYSAGDPSSFSAYLNGQVMLSGDKNGTGVAAQTAAGATVLGHSKLNFFSASASLSASLAVPSGMVTVKVLGYTEYSKNLGFTGSLLPNTDFFKQGYDSCMPYTPDLCVVQVFFVGPIPVQVSVGVKGSVALNYSIGLNKGVASASLTPGVSGSVYVEAAIQFFVADVGVGASLTLINDNLPIGVTATLAPDYFTSPPEWGVKWGFNITGLTTRL
jgi:hypothetical protein